jgi:hypothetical protein
VQYDPSGAHLLFASGYDSLIGSFKLMSAPLGTAAPATTLMSGVVNWTISPFTATAIGGTALVSGAANLWAGPLTGAGTALGAISSTNAQLFFSGDEKRLFSEDAGTGASFYAKLGAAGTTEFDDGVIPNGLFPDGTGANVIELAQHTGDPTFFVGRVAVP